MKRRFKVEVLMRRSQRDVQLPSFTRLILPYNSLNARIIRLNVQFYNKREKFHNRIIDVIWTFRSLIRKFSIQDGDLSKNCLKKYLLIKLSFSNFTKVRTFIWIKKKKKQLHKGCLDLENTFPEVFTQLFKKFKLIQV